MPTQRTNINPLATPDNAKVLSRQRKPMRPNDAFIIATSEDIVSYHTYDIMRAAQYLHAWGIGLQAELRRRYENGTQ